MNVADVEQRISGFLSRKQVEHPELIINGRHESRTIKYAQELRTRGQLLFN